MSIQISQRHGTRRSISLGAGRLGVHEVDICGYPPFHELARQYFKCEKAADRRCRAFEARYMRVTEFMRGGSHYKQTLDFARVPIIALSRSSSLFQDGC